MTKADHGALLTPPQWPDLAVAAALLGGTSLFGGRGSLWAPVIGALLFATVQNGLVIIDANPYVYLVLTGAVIFAAALLDRVRSDALATQGRPSLESL